MYEKINNLCLKRTNIRRTCRIMKLTTLLLVISMGTCYSSISYSQSTRISVDLKGETIKQVLSEIEKKSEYVFFYLDDVLDVNRKVTVSAKNETVENILKQVLNPKSNSYLVSDRQIYILKENHQNTSIKTKQQQREIKGKVTDENGEPLQGVTVSVESTDKQTSTDNEGEFELPISQNDGALLFSNIGYKSHRHVLANEREVNIILQNEVTGLDELVVVG